MAFLYNLLGYSLPGCLDGTPDSLNAGDSSCTIYL
jgi:hypothetical protein